jgi:multidrug efflux pump subunit AcrA (membrane-fusion protein)
MIMKHRKLILTGLIILLLIDFGLLYQGYKSGQTPNYDFVTVKKGDIAQTVSSTGSAEPASQINLQFTGSGRVTDIKVNVGDKVSAGQILISQDSSDLVFQAQSYEAALAIAQAKLSQLLSGASAEDIALAQTAVSNAQKNLDDAQKTLANAQTSADISLNDVYEDGQRTLSSSLLTTQTSLQANADALDSNKLNLYNSASNSQALTDAKNLRYQAELDYNSAKPIINGAISSFNQSSIDSALERLKSTVSFSISALARTYDVLLSVVISSQLTQTELDVFKTNIAAARTNLNTALTNLVSAQQTTASQKNTNQTNINTAQAAVTVDQGALQIVQDQLALKLARPRQSDVDLYTAQVKQAQANLNQVRNQIAQKSLIAPIDGIITDILFEKGEMASPTQTAISMNSLSDFEIKSDIAESDIAKIMLGNPVAVTFDAFGENEKWQGKVIKIDPAQTVIQGVVYYTTTVGLSGTDSKVKAGMTANLEIETSRHTDVLVIPLRAVQQNNNVKTVKIMEEGQIKDRQVQTGIRNDQGEVEIISGLVEGQSVAIPK